MVGGLQVATADSKYILIEDAEIAAFQANLRGRVLRDGDAGYDDARKIWNGMIDRRPALIARCAGVADVMAAVNFARVNDLRLSVRDGGHNITGNAVRWWADDRPIANEGVESRSNKTHGQRPGGPHLG
jgi:FAD/FMN-containing dehydrogenase